jgi:Zn-dependent protease with chaperone function
VPRVPSDLARRLSRGAALTIAGLLLAGGCATTPSGVMQATVRKATPVESRLTRDAITPLLQALEDPTVHTPGCAIGLGVAVSPRINASIARNRKDRCPRFAIVLTEGALTRLPVGMLRAVLAHELGHLVRQHTGRNTQAQEIAADEFATRLLKRLEPRHADACLQLVYVFSVLAEPGNAGWFAAHPSPDRRAEAALAQCNR